MGSEGAAVAAIVDDWHGVDYDSRWTVKDVLLYALAVGARPPAELSLVYEKHGPEMLPTFATRLAGIALEEFGTFLMRSGLTTLLYSTVVRISGSLPVECDVARTSARIGEKRNAGRHLLVDLEVETQASGQPLSTVLHTIWIKGASVEGLPSMKQDTDIAEPADGWSRQLDEVHPEQYAVWRLQERISLENPYPDELHFDPVFTESQGIGKPFITGECTMGFMCRAARSALGIGHSIVEVGARFRGKVYPGDVLETLISPIGAHGHVDMMVRNQSGEIVLSNGFARLARQ